MSKRAGTDGSLLASLPWTLGALIFSVLAHLQFLPKWVIAVFVTCCGWRWLVERRRWRLPPAWVRIVLALLCNLITAPGLLRLFYRDRSNPSSTALVAPQVDVPAGV